MKKRAADLIADILSEHGITDIFSVAGGGSMFLNDAFGHRQDISVTFHHHEQACAMAAEGYVRASGKMACVCVTTGPGGTNAVTGVLGAYQDNYPMLVISGQVRYQTSALSVGLSLRFMGEQEHNIVDTVRTLTKYASVVRKPEDIRYETEKAIYIANDKRKGPCWIDIPLDVQGAFVDSDDLRGYEPQEKKEIYDLAVLTEEIKKAERPLILAGSAVRSAKCTDEFRAAVKKLGIPVLAATYNADLCPLGHEFYYGNFGVNGGRAGNFMVQNADLIIGMGCRMAFRQIGFQYESFSPYSKRAVIDADPEELKKPTLRIDVPICADIADVIHDLSCVKEKLYEDKSGWINFCNRLKERFPVYMPKFETSDAVNPYFFTKKLYEYLKEDAVIVLGNSSIAGHVLQMGIRYPQQRVINNMNCGSMGYDLPAAIGAAVALKRDIVLLTGDGSCMMNLQELMTVRHYRLPLKIFIFSNGGYQAIVRTQKNMFEGRYTGCTKETGVEMPDFKKIAEGFEIPYRLLENHSQTQTWLKEILEQQGMVICEVLQDKEQMIEPRSMSKKSEDGTIISPELDDLYPFLDRQLYQSLHGFYRGIL